jgi:hypothetical protein
VPGLSFAHHEQWDLRLAYLRGRTRHSTLLPKSLQITQRILAFTDAVMHFLSDWKAGYPSCATNTQERVASENQVAGCSLDLLIHFN